MKNVITMLLKHLQQQKDKKKKRSTHHFLDEDYAVVSWKIICSTKIVSLGMSKTKLLLLVA